MTSFAFDEGRISGSRYHTAKPIFDWTSESVNSFTLVNFRWMDMMEWCVETFGPTPEDGVWTPNARWYSNNAKFWFRDEKDMLMFALRWS